MINHDELKNLIRLKALELGFEACGFARAERVSEDVIACYNKWLADGKNDCMDYASRYSNVRFDPRELLQGAKTVISVALGYYPQTKQPINAPRFSYYAYGEDYHDVVRTRLFNLAAYIKEITGEDSRVCVDTAPILEKYWAQQAGIGMLGRNRLLIIPGKGSFFFLGELVTTLDITPDTPCTLTCGNCNRCVEACPGGALNSEGGLDARRCLSCQLIERRSELPQWVAKVAGNRVYGCDECQLCCPHNASALPSSVEEFVPSREFLDITFNSLSKMTPDDFRRIFHHSAVRRAKLEGLQRNVQLVMKESVNFDKKA